MIRFFLIVFSVLLSFNNLIAQSFHHIESYIGLSTLEKNNGVAIADFDGDGDLDMFVVAMAKDDDAIASSHSKLFSNNNDGTFTDVTQNSGLENLFPVNEDVKTTIALSGYKFGAFWGDYDNDGFPDLFMTHINKVQLFHNLGNGTFKDVTVEAGFNKYNDCVNTGALWFDYNKDGFLDLYVSDWGTQNEGNRLYKNDGDGTFTNVSEIFNGVIKKHSYQCIPFDFNGDGWLDLYVANDYRTETNDLFINNNGIGFTEQAATYGLDHAKDDMGIAIGDYNNDGFFDIYITTIDENGLFVTTGNNSYNNLSKDLNVHYTEWSWDVTFSDFDLDRDEDIYILNGFNSSNSLISDNIYFENLFANGNSAFIDSSQKTRLEEATISVGAGVFDYDNDGDLDMIVTNNDGPSYFYENKLTDFVKPVDDLHWFKVKLEGTVSNRDAIGATLSVRTVSGTLYRYYTGKGFLSQNLKPVHFGLGKDAEILELKIIWPSGIIEIFNNLPADKVVLVKEKNGYEILNITPSIKPYGCTDSSSCNYNVNAIVNTGVCTYLETSKISGAVNAYKNSVEFYTYPLKDGTQFNWQVSGGEIIEILDNSIKVQWGAESSGKITLIETNSICTSQPEELKVDLFDEFTVIKEWSIVRLWNETLLELIRKDYARPTVHARNLFHTSIAMYDAWAVYDEKASPYLLGKNVHSYECQFEGFITTENKEEARKKTIAYAAFRLLLERFKYAPNPTMSQSILDAIMEELGYDTSITNDDYTTGDPIALGNYIANQVINYGLQDGSNEINQYENLYYQPINAPLNLLLPEDIESINPNRWQPLMFNSFIDQSGNVLGGVTPDFLSPEWGNVYPFSMEDNDKTTYTRDGHDYDVYYDPGAPPSVSSDDYKWAFSLVSNWSSHLDPHDGVIWDISPKSIGNISTNQFPQQYSDYKDFYNEIDGGDIGIGRTINPYTKASYQEQFVPRGDYTRVLAEFWADGPDSETPPGHWFTILNYVNDHELLKKQFNGEGDILEDLEWDVKAYFILGGAMHDSAIAAWGIKGWYDYIRPISAIRYMCAKGQCTDSSKPNYDPSGINLKEGFVEIIESGDPLVGLNNENLGKIKLYSWKGHDYINDPKVDEAGVGWILAENWWPYQRPTFVTPPFAGYISGHSTYSRAAAEVLTLITGDEYFPGGMGEFVAKKNEFLVFEEGPSVNLTLQWATYRDASDQCSLSRIWGGIHPPVDDIKGRLIGEEIGNKAFNFGVKYFDGNDESITVSDEEIKVYPNPMNTSLNNIYVTNTAIDDIFNLYDIRGRFIIIPVVNYDETNKVSRLTLPKSISTGIYILKINNLSRKIIISN